MDLYSLLIRPLLFSLDAERAHRFTLWLGGLVSHTPLLGLVSALYKPPRYDNLATNVFGLDFDAPVGLAAGVDKDGVAIDFWEALGFGFVEAGTVTPGTGQPGNDPPRLERVIEDEAVVNRMGFNNRGATHLAERLKSKKGRIPVGANLGKAKITPLERAADDYEESLTTVWSSADYIVVNVSSPNTPNLRDLQAVEALEPLLSRVGTVNREMASAMSSKPRPLLLKIAPDLADEDVDAVADLVVGLELDGIVATNTTLRHDLLSRPARIEGGVSGPPLGPRSLALIRRLFKKLDGKVPIVGVGGIRTADEAYQRIRAGADLVQIYTGLVYEGPTVVAAILKGMSQRVCRDGYNSIKDAVGQDV